MNIATTTNFAIDLLLHYKLQTIKGILTNTINN